MPIKEKKNRIYKNVRNTKTKPQVSGVHSNDSGVAKSNGLYTHVLMSIYMSLD